VSIWQTNRTFLCDEEHTAWASHYLELLASK
jgi:hypothetical protein